MFPAGSAGAFMYYAVQGLTFAVLVLAANTSYQGFPRLCAVLARDRFFPRQFVNLGDRLVYSNGIIVLAGLASLLIWAFNADVNSLIHLYVIGVFTAFTLSQTGMVRYWRRHKQPGWRRKAAINGAGRSRRPSSPAGRSRRSSSRAPGRSPSRSRCSSLGFYGINRHYRKVARRLRAGVGAVAAAPPPTNQVVLYVESYDAALREAVWYARQIAGDDFRAIHVVGAESDTGLPPALPAADRQRTPTSRSSTPEDGRVDAVIDYVWALPRGESSFVTVIIPEQFKRASFLEAAIAPHRVLAEGAPAQGARRRDQRTCRCSRRAQRVAAPEAGGLPRPASPAPTPPRCGRSTTRARSASRTRRRSSSPSTPRRPSASRPSGSCGRWASPLEVEEAHFRDLGDPLLRYLRRITADPDAVVVVVMPELVFSGPQRLLHNQRALYIKRLLLFEPRVILTSVPYRLT